MNVRELIEQLQQLDPDLLVLGRGYEDGYDAATEVKVMNLTHEPENPYWSGKYQDPWRDDDGRERKPYLVIE